MTQRTSLLALSLSCSLWSLGCGGDSDFTTLTASSALTPASEPSAEEPSTEGSGTEPESAEADAVQAPNDSERPPGTAGENAEPISEGEDALDPSSAPQGFSVVHSDYSTYGVSLVTAGGQVKAADFVSAASADSGLSAPFSDLALPSSRTPGEVVVINRSGAGFLTFVDVGTAEVRAQLSVDTGFAANPQDYVPLSDTKAYVPRHAPNFAAGAEPFDEGNDLLIVDPSVPEVTGRIDLMEALDGAPAGHYPRAARALVAGGLVRVALLGFDEFFDSLVDSRIVTVDPASDQIENVLVLEGMQNCGALALSPDGQRLAVACSGPFGVDPATAFPQSGIVLLQVGEELTELDRFAAATLGGEMIASLSFASDSTVAFTTYGRYNADRTDQEAPDTARLVNLDTGELIGAPLHASETTPFTLGDIACIPELGTCLLADAETNGGTVQIFSIRQDGTLDNPTARATDFGLGLPPRSFGLY